MWMWLGQALAATLTVGPTSAYPTLDDAWAVAVDGDVLELEAGTYVADALPLFGLQLTVRAAPGAEVIVEALGGDDGAFDAGGASHLIVEGITLDGGGASRLIHSSGSRVDLLGVVGQDGAADSGGCVQASDSRVRLVDTELTGCVTTGALSADGGAVQSTGVGSLAIVGGRLADNRTNGQSSGGAVACTAYTCTLFEVELEGNHSSSGGAVYVAALGGSRLVASTLVGNSADGEGGGLYAGGGDYYRSVEASGSVFCGNYAEVWGGGVHATTEIAVRHSTFVGNTVLSGVDGAALRATHPTSSVDHAVVAHHLGPGTAVYHGGVGPLSYTALYDNDGGDLTGFVAGVGVIYGLDPLFVVPFDGDCDLAGLHPGAGSPLIDAGDPTVTDPDGSIADLGAFGGPFAPDADDADGDGFTTRSDCDDTQADVFPGADEVPGDAIDQDCDGMDDCYFDGDDDGFGTDTVTAGLTLDCTGLWEAPVPGDCNDGRSQHYPGAYQWFYDGDGDGEGTGVSVPSCLPEPPLDGYVRGGDDCDDEDPEVFPGQTESCLRPLDDLNCDGIIGADTEGFNDGLLYYLDADGDGYGDFLELYQGCEPPEDFVTDSTDCDDTRAEVNPAAVEVCDPDDLDEDCNGLADNFDPDATGKSDWYVDLDRDGWGQQLTQACDPMVGLVAVAGDCDDRRAWVNPDGIEVCDPGGLDEDCNGEAGEACSDPITSSPTTPTTSATTATAPHSVTVEGDCEGCASAPRGALWMLAVGAMAARRRRVRSPRHDSLARRLRSR